MNSIELREQRAKLIHDARGIVNKSDAEQRSLLAEEKEQWDKYMVEAEKMEATIETIERKEATEKAERDLESSSKRKATPSFSPQKDKPDYERAVAAWLCKPLKDYRCSSDDMENAERAGIDINNRFLKIDFNMPVKRQQRGLSVGGSGSGAELAVYDFGQGFTEALLFTGNVLNDVTIRNTPNGQTYNEILVDDTSSSNWAEIVTETGTQSLTPDPTTTNVAMYDFVYSTRGIQVSRNLVQDSIVPVIPLVTRLAATRLARKWNKDAMVGAGTTEPFGLVTRSTDSSVVVAGTNASPTASWDDLAKLADAIDPAYAAEEGAGYYMHTSTRWAYRKVKDSNGRYVLDISTIPGQPDTAWGYPVRVNNAMGKLSTASAKAVIFCSPKHYVWRQTASLELIRTDELYLRSNQIAFFGFARAYGNLVNPSASAYLKAPAS